MYTDEGYLFSRIMYVALTCCWSRLYVSIRKVLRPAISAQVLLGFPVSIANAGMVPCTPSCYCMLLMQPTKIKSKPPKFMFVMFDMYVKLPPDASPIAVNKFYLTSPTHQRPTTCSRTAQVKFSLTWASFVISGISSSPSLSSDDSSFKALSRIMTTNTLQRLSQRLWKVLSNHLATTHQTPRKMHHTAIHGLNTDKVTRHNYLWNFSSMIITPCRFQLYIFELDKYPYPECCCGTCNP